MSSSLLKKMFKNVILKKQIENENKSKRELFKTSINKKYRLVLIEKLIEFDNNRRDYSLRIDNDFYKNSTQLN